MNKAELTPSVWLYAIHSKNTHLIHLLESKEVPPPKSIRKETNKDVDYSIKNYDQCLIESIKCHHNGIDYYIENNLLDQTEEELQQNEEIISNYIKYHNYSHFQIEIIINHGFFLFTFYGYNKFLTFY